MTNPFTPATKESVYLRILMTGGPGTGKTFSAMQVASEIAKLEDGKIAFLDTEGRSARRYADEFTFDVLEIADDYNPQKFIDAIKSAEQYGYKVLVIDSFSHAWAGEGGVLSIADRSAKGKGGNEFAGWATAKPVQNNLVSAIQNANIHIIGTARSKIEYAMEPNSKGKLSPVQIGMGSVQDSKFDYEFDIVGLIGTDHTMTITKSRCRPLNATNTQVIKDYEHFAAVAHSWATDGTPPQKQLQTLNEFRDAVHAQIGNISDEDIARLLGFAKLTVPTLTAKRDAGVYDTLNNLVLMVVEAFNREQEQAKPVEDSTPPPVANGKAPTQSSLIDVPEPDRTYDESNLPF